MTATRVPAAPTAEWMAWVQSVETVGVQVPNVASPELHVTRSVLDLKDQVLQVFDARSIGFATWTFAYDLVGRRTSAAHATGTGTRWSLSDAAGNPIWSRDARAIEVDRTFDVLNRPLAEESDDGGTVKLRRMWTYVPYNAADSTSKGKNLFGRVEEERDADGLRYFEYDWRGLVTKVSHQFWDADWQNSSWTLYSNVDEAAIPSAARGTLSSWLGLTDLTDTTTVTVTTSYDAAGRPIEELWPNGMKRRWTNNAAGNLEKVEYDRGTGYETGVDAATYNARGQLTGYTHGNNVVCTREYDTITERLTRLFARKLAPSEVRFQDLSYAYDPLGNPVQITDQLATSSFTSNQIIPNTRTFRYDPRYRLIRATGRRHKNATDGIDAPETPSPALTDYVPYTHRYSYDAMGNFTTNQEYKSGTNNLKYKAGLPDLFDGHGVESYSYDANGCCTSTPRHQAMGYSFDAQPVFVDMGGNTKVRYRRHADQRVMRFVTKSGGISGLGVYLGPWEYHRRAGGTAFTKVVLRVEGKQRHAQAERVLAGTDDSSLPVFHVHADHLGSAQTLTKDDGTLLCQEEFFAYGRSSDRRNSKVRYRYIGVERDEDAGLCMTGPRTHDPVVGRFLQGDPVMGGAAYVYSRGNPVMRMDRNGYADTPPAPETNHSGIPVSVVQVNPTVLPDTLDPGSLGVAWNNARAAQPDPTRESGIRIYIVEGQENLVAGAYIHKGDPNRGSGLKGSVTWSEDDLTRSEETTAAREGVDVELLRDRGGYHNHPDETKETLRWSNRADIDDLLAPTNSMKGVVEVIQAKVDGYTEVAIFQPHPELPNTPRLPNGPTLSGAQLAAVMDRVSPGRGAVYGGMPGEVMKRIEPSTEFLSARYLARLDRAVVRAKEQ